jgi:arylsulfatase A-like enzyme
MKLLEIAVSVITQVKSRAGRLPVQLFFLLMLAAAYRVEIYRLFSGIYGDPAGGTFLYTARSLPGDALYLIFFAAIYFFTAIISRPGSELRAWIPLTALIAFGYLFTLGYFHIFEKPADASMFGSGLGTFWKEILNSTLHEIRGRTISSVAAASAALIIFYLSLTFFRSRYVHAAAALLLPLAALMIPPVHYTDAKGRMVPAQELDAVTRALYPNPVMNIIRAPFSGRKEMPLQPIPSPPETADGSADDSSLLSLYNPGEIPAVKMPRRRYNIIFYFFESTSEPYIGTIVKGKSVTPVWDRLMNNSVIFKKHYAGYPLSVNALFNVFSSGPTPIKKKWVPMHNPEFKVKAVTEVFKENGYRTAVLHSGDLNNFEHKRYLKNRGVDLMLDMKNIDRQKYKMITPYSLDDRVMFKPALDFMVKDEAPFFVSFFPVLPHHPYTFPYEEFYIYSAAEISAEPSAKRKAWMRYINSLHFSDYCLGELYSAMETAGLLENTLLFVFADHGEAFYRHPGNYLHSLYLYDDNVRVPFIVHNPSLFPGKIIYPGISSHVDIAPTALSVAGIVPPAEYTGAPLLARHRSRAAYFHTDWDTDYSGMRDGKWKYIMRADTGAGQLFDMEADPGETANRAAEFPEIAADLKKRVEGNRAAAEKYYLKHKR